jgi:methionyl aminopeptidase
VKIDITAFKDGMHGDLCAAFGVGEIAPEAADLIERTREALTRGIRSVAPGREINVIGRAIESYARRFGYGVVRDYTGHGVGEAFHSGLIVPHYDAAPDHATVMEPGMVFTIEPMLTIGTPDHPGTVDWEEWDDGWTVVTRDRRLTAQFEHTIVVTERGSEILTLP